MKFERISFPKNQMIKLIIWLLVSLDETNRACEEYKILELTPKTIRFKADCVLSSPVDEFMVSNCSIG